MSAVVRNRNIKTDKVKNVQKNRMSAMPTQVKPGQTADSNLATKAT